MKIDFALLVTKASDALRNDVAPHVSHDYARGQVYAVVSLLETLALQGDWSRTMLLEQLAVQRAGLDGLFEALPADGGLFDRARPAAPDTDTTEGLFAELERGNRTLVAIGRWLGTDGQRLSAGERDALGAKLDDTMRALNEREWRSVAPQRLAQMLSTGERS